MKSTIILIPARMNSTRFPGKPLTNLGGKTMIERVEENCDLGDPALICTDTKEIQDKCKFAIIDTTPYENGTERCAGAMIHLHGFYECYINVQGDMPDVNPAMIMQVQALLNAGHDIVTLYTDLSDKEKNDPNAVKIIVNNDGWAQWFGRGITGYGQKHLGIYGFSREALSKYLQMERPSAESIEGLEQLRWLHNGWKIKCAKVRFDGIEINTPEDASLWNSLNPT